MYPAARTHTYLWISGYTFTFLRASGSERGDQKKGERQRSRARRTMESRQRELRDGGPRGACKVAPKGHAEAGGSKEEPVK